MNCTLAHMPPCIEWLSSVIGAHLPCQKQHTLRWCFVWTSDYQPLLNWVTIHRLRINHKTNHFTIYVFIESIVWVLFGFFLLLLFFQYTSKQNNKIIETNWRVSVLFFSYLSFWNCNLLSHIWANNESIRTNNTKIIFQIASLNDIFSSYS